MNFMLTICTLLFMLSMKLMLINSMFIMEFPINFFSTASFKLSFMLDWMSLMFSSTVLFISGMIYIYSNIYISKKYMNRFLLTLISFIMSMLMLIFSNNIFFLLLGWDGLGISSYILIMFYQDSKSCESASLTIISNRVGDIFILLAISTLFSVGNWNYLINSSFTNLTMMFLLIASISKSAQFPFSAWLPAAMAAPTPISALVHSSTLVTAGVFLMIRLTTNIHPNTLMIMLIIAITTMMMASMSSIWELDMKKIIAYSTLSQIAMMMFSISIKNYQIAFFHLITHAMFKSTLFLCSGLLINYTNYQDLRKQFFNSSNYLSNLIISSITSLALAGLPFLAGFYSKDLIIEMTLYKTKNTLIFTMMVMSMSLTSWYSLRMMIILSQMFTKSKTDLIFNNMNKMMIPINMMALFSILMGTLMSWIIPMKNFLITPINLKVLMLISMMMGFIMSFSKFKNLKHPMLSEYLISLWFLHFMTVISSMKISKPSSLYFHSDKTWNEFMIMMVSKISWMNYSKMVLSMLIPPMIILMMMMWMI